MKTFHLVFGGLVVITFLLTGQYMDRYLAHLEFTPDLHRMFYRSRHIYILLAGLLNLGLGAYLRLAEERWRRVLQAIGSLLIVTATVLFVMAFIYEPPVTNFGAPFARKAIYLISYGTLMHAISAIRIRKAEKRGQG